AEGARLDRLEAGPARRAGEVDAQDAVLPAVVLLDREEDRPLAELQGQVDALGQAGADPVADHQTVDDRLDGVRLGPGGPRGLIGEVDDLAVDAGADELGAADRLEGVEVLALAAPDQGGEHQDLAARRQPEDAGDHLFGGLAADRLAARRAMRYTGPG